MTVRAIFFDSSVINFNLLYAGMLRFSVAQQGAIKALFEKLEPIKRSVGKSRDELTFAQQCLKKNMMASPHDIRGARRLSVIFSLMEVKLKLKTIQNSKTYIISK